MEFSGRAVVNVGITGLDISVWNITRGEHSVGRLRTNTFQVALERAGRHFDAS